MGCRDRVTEGVASRALLRVLENWSPPFPVFFFYYPSGRPQPAALAALIERCAWTAIGASDLTIYEV